ncbi:hypothetical protein [Bulleidia sp. zg-1006]|uniref:hypothetical protein n=1 Tax=Bulleidia sp. zg-1006 TaxID=2806552 RepID=UPI001939FDC7|nr:hypothetical protein [Bulleidia sp. zg-1006]QRG87095.1 hypothetical protein JOS54_01955 [Bulleidia sp. zg-1006]
MKSIVDTFEKVGIVPAVVIDDLEELRPLTRALLNGGLPCAEVTLLESISASHNGGKALMNGNGRVQR